MATALAPIKIDAQTDELVSHAAHFLHQTKKSIVDVAVREYIDKHRDEIQAGVEAALARLDGSRENAVAMVTA